MQYILQGRIYVTIGTKNNKYGEISGRLSEDLNTRKGKHTKVFIDTMILRMLIILLISQLTLLQLCPAKQREEGCCFWCRSCWHPSSFVSVLYLLNPRMDFNQTCIDT